MHLNILIQIHENLSHWCIEQSETIHRIVPSRLVLNIRDALPHITLYDSIFPSKNFNIIKDALQNISRSTAPFNISIINKSICFGFIFLEVKSTHELMTLHKALVRHLSTLREKNVQYSESQLPGITNTIKDNLCTYGMWACNDSYRPHITLSKPCDPYACQTALDLLPSQTNIQEQVMEISLAVTGSEGSCSKILHSFPLKK